MRVIAGSAKGRILRPPRTSATRPITDRAKESLFNILTPRTGGRRFLDLFAGTGSVGIEALSRGAACATFVERSGPALAGIRHNLEVTGLAARAEVVGRPRVPLPVSPFGCAAARHGRLEVRVEQHGLLRLDQLRHHRHRLDVRTPLPAGDLTRAHRHRRLHRLPCRPVEDHNLRFPVRLRTTLFPIQQHALVGLQQRDRDEAAVLAQVPPATRTGRGLDLGRVQRIQRVCQRALLYSPHTVS